MAVTRTSSGPTAGRRPRRSRWIESIRSVDHGSTDAAPVRPRHWCAQHPVTYVANRPCSGVHQHHRPGAAQLPSGLTEHPVHDRGVDSSTTRNATRRRSRRSRRLRRRVRRARPPRHRPGSEERSSLSTESLRSSRGALSLRFLVSHAEPLATPEVARIVGTPRRHPEDSPNDRLVATVSMNELNPSAVCTGGAPPPAGLPSGRIGQESPRRTG
jgi:hypothetical protein